MATMAVLSEGMGEGRNVTNLEVEAQDTNVDELATCQGDAAMPKSKERKPKGEGGGPLNSTKVTKGKAMAGKEVVA